MMPRQNHTMWIAVIAMALSITPTAPAIDPVLPPEVEDFLDNHPGTFGGLSNDGVNVLYGAVMAENTGGVAAGTFVKNFLDSHITLFGTDDPDDIVELSAIDSGSGAFRVYTYGQRIDGLEVVGSVIKVPVPIGQQESIRYIGFRTVTKPVSFPADDSLGIQSE